MSTDDEEISIDVEVDPNLLETEVAWLEDAIRTLAGVVSVFRCGVGLPNEAAGVVRVEYHLEMTTHKWGDKHEDMLKKCMGGPAPIPFGGRKPTTNTFVTDDVRLADRLVRRMPDVGARVTIWRVSFKGEKRTECKLLEPRDMFYEMNLRQPA